MKKTISLVVLAMLLAVSTNSFAQLTFGVKAGFNLANINPETELPSGFERSSRLSINFGGIVNYGISENLFIESGLFLSGKGYKLKWTDQQGQGTVTTTMTFSPLYLEIPITAMYSLDLKPMKLQFFAGPYLGFGIGGKIYTDYEGAGTLPSGYKLPDNKSESINFGSDDANDDMKMMDFGINVGAGINYNNILFRLQYGLGLANLSTSSDSNKGFKNNVIGISFGYMFGK